MSLLRVSVVGFSMLLAIGCEDGATNNGGSGYQAGTTDPGFQPGLTGSGGNGGGVAAQSTGLPCAVQAVVEAKCSLCHGAAMSGGAPFSLVTQQDFQNMGADGSAVHLLAKGRINQPAGSSIKMPPPGQPELTPAEFATLDGWLGGGALYSNEVCSVGGGGGGVLPVDDGTRAADIDDCATFLSYANGSPDMPFVVEGGEIYTNFTFTNPWAGEQVQAVSIRHVVPDPDGVVHHTLLYQAPGALATGATASGGTHGNDVLMAGWVPGGSDTLMPPEVGLEMSGGDFTIEIHHFNSSGALKQSRNGLEICVTHTPRANAAAVHWLGQELQIGIPAAEWKGTCTPDYSKGPITILTSWPHMHLQGKHMKTVINRGAGGEDILVDEDFDFYFQTSYDTPAVLTDGDTLTTTCNFNQPMSFGTGTMEEMCYNFVIAYPAGAFAGAGLTSSVNHCLGF